MNYPEFTIYTIPNCLYCTKAKAKMREYNVTYKEVLLDKQDYLEQVNMRIKTDIYIKTAPQIVNKNELIGGYNELCIFLDNYYHDMTDEF